MAEHDISLMTGKELGDKLNRLADRCQEEDDKTQKFYVKKRGGKFEVFRVKFRPKKNRLRQGFVRFGDGHRPTWNGLKSTLRDLVGQYKMFASTVMESYTKYDFSTLKFKASLLLLLEIAQSGIDAATYEARFETEQAIRAALKKNSCNADTEDLTTMFAVRRGSTAKDTKRYRRSFERIMIRATSRRMRAMLRQGYFTQNTKKRLRKNVSLFRQTEDAIIYDATQTLLKILKDDEYFDLRNKEAYKIIVSVFDSRTA